MTIPQDYVERTYAGVLGKIIGVYLGRPFEGWSRENIESRLGEVWYYVNEKTGGPLIVADDDISGTFTFLRALPDYGNSLDLTPAQIGQTWLNYIIENRSILWWGGMGNSTEHTAYLRLKSGIPAPRSGSIELNGQVVAEQIGAQIFIDGWAMVSPGNPEQAADLARRAGSVSHDGEAVYGARVLAAMEAQAFVEPDIDRLIDVGISFIPKDSVIARMIADIRRWRTEEPEWREAFKLLEANYGSGKYGGGPHIVPNHGLVILSLLYGDDDFQKTLMIVNTCGWDTDCNSGNAGCLMGIKLGLDGLDAGPDWRGPVADRLYLPTADGGRVMTDAVTETYHIVNSGRALTGEAPLGPKDNARFHFDLPGAVQGFRSEMPANPRRLRVEYATGQPVLRGSARFTQDLGTVHLENVEGHSLKGNRSLALRYHHVGAGRPARAAADTFVATAAATLGYGLMASPTLYPGQTVRAGVIADEGNSTDVSCSLYIRAYGADDALVRTRGPKVGLKAGDSHEFEWTVGDTGGAPIAEIGVEIDSRKRADGTVHLDYLTWDGAPDVTLTRPATGGNMWRQAWVNGMDDVVGGAWFPEPYRLTKNEGRGLLIQGTREWTDYRVSADVTPHLVAAAGIAARVQGMRRYYGLLLYRDGKARLIKALDGDTILAETDFDWKFDETHELCLEAAGTHLQAWIGDQKIFDVEDTERPLNSGAVALVCEEGQTATQTVRICPAG